MLAAVTPADAAGAGTSPFTVRVAEARRRFGPLVVGLDPSAALLGEWGLDDDAGGLERFVDTVLEAFAGHAGLAKPQSAFFERHGWRGIRALDRLVSDLRAAGVVVVLDVKRGDIGSTSAAYASAYLGAGAALRADAITVTPYLGVDALEPFFAAAADAGDGLFVVVRSSNPQGRPLQTARDADGRSVEELLLGELAARNADSGTGLGSFGAVFSPNHGAPSGIDLAAVQGYFLAPGLGAQGATVEDAATCFAACPERALPSASRSLLSSGSDPGRLRDAATALNEKLRLALGR